MTTDKRSKTINFKHEYYKLKQNIFPTLRGKSFKAKPGEIVKITINRQFFCYALVQDTIILKITDIPLMALKYDGEYPDFHINSRQEFIDLLNNFYPRNRFPNVAANKNSELKLIILQKLTCDNCTTRTAGICQWTNHELDCVYHSYLYYDKISLIDNKPILNLFNVVK